MINLYYHSPGEKNENKGINPRSPIQNTIGCFIYVNRMEDS